MNIARTLLSMVLTAFAAFSICGTAAGQHNNFILVIDAGHGGEDPGATRGRYLEKEINLEVALALGSLIQRNISGVDVLYTRTEDRAVGLAARGDFANRAGADLFLSIHTNANPSQSANGSETYVMGMDKNEANLEVAKLENEVMRYEDNYTTTYAAFDPSSTEMSIIMGMMQYAHFESSIAFARLVQRRFAADTPLRDRGAKQGPFAVLWKPTMPRVLVEMGFISNDTDRRYLFSDRGKEAIVKALFDAFRDYKESIGSSSAPATVPAPILVQTPTVTTTPATTPPVTTAPATTVVPQPVILQPVETSTPATATPSRPEREETAARNPVVFAPAPVREYWVQLAAMSTSVSVLDARWAPFRGEVVERQIDGWFKYALGPYTQAEATAKLAQVRRTKFRDAFIAR